MIVDDLFQLAAARRDVVDAVFWGRLDITPLKGIRKTDVTVGMDPKTIDSRERFSVEREYMI